jgi:D-sedoheptulose 7-phosphate isomerase
MSSDLIAKWFNDSIDTKRSALEGCAGEIERAGEIIWDALRSGNKVLVCGNGGSAADAQHLACELVGCFIARDRDALPCVALGANMPVFTSVANDFSFNDSFARELRALGREDDVLVAISTSGRSPNVWQAVEAAKALDMQTIALTGKDGGPLRDLAELAIVVPSEHTPHIQETHITIIHLWCAMVEA